jgi:hypothetical protein
MKLICKPAVYSKHDIYHVWPEGGDLAALSPKVWDGGMYFSIRDKEHLKALGYTELAIINGQATNIVKL